MSIGNKYEKNSQQCVDKAKRLHEKFDLWLTLYLNKMCFCGLQTKATQLCIREIVRAFETSGRERTLEINKYNQILYAKTLVEIFKQVSSRNVQFALKMIK